MCDKNAQLKAANLLIHCWRALSCSRRQHVHTENRTSLVFLSFLRSLPDERFMLSHVTSLREVLHCIIDLWRSICCCASSLYSKLKVHRRIHSPQAPFNFNCLIYASQNSHRKWKAQNLIPNRETFFLENFTFLTIFFVSRIDSTSHFARLKLIWLAFASILLIAFLERRREVKLDRSIVIAGFWVPAELEAKLRVSRKFFFFSLQCE